MEKIIERYWFRGQVMHNNPMVNPEDGWVQGFYWQDLYQGEIKHFIRSSELIWEVKPETVGLFTGFYDSSTDPKPIFEGDILHTMFADGSNCFDLVGWNVKKGCFGIMDSIDYNAVLEDEEKEYSHTIFEWMIQKKTQSVVVGNIYENAELMLQ